MAFVMVLHLPPDRKSMLTEILARWTSMPVIDVTGRVAIEPNHVSGWGQESDRRQAYLAGFDHHLTKPIDPDQLEDLFEKAAG
jgi:CheY-like chemotaxis protein